MKTKLRWATGGACLAGLVLLTGCPEQKPEQAEGESSAGGGAETQQQQTEFGGRQEATSPVSPEEEGIGAVGFSGEYDSPPESGAARPDTPVQGQRPLELLVGAGVDEKRYEELAADGFPVEEVESAVREALLESGIGEETAADEARRIAGWVANWNEAENTTNTGTGTENSGQEPGNPGGEMN